MYERDLQALVRGLRSDAAKKNEAKFIAEVVDEIRKEITSKDMDIKGGAVCKLTYLDMLGYDMSWASFHVVEVMSSPHFHLKTGGYLAAAQSFDENTDVLMLTTNLLKKDMASGSHPEISAALNCLAHILTPELARDLALDIIPMLNHSRPLIRKRAILVLYKMMLLDSDALDRGFNKLREKLEDPDVVKYIALLALVKIVPSHPHLVAEHQRLVLGSVSDNDMSIRMRALDLLSAMVNRQTLQHVVQHLLSHLSPESTPGPGQSAVQALSQAISGVAPSATPPSLSPPYRLDVARRILEMCSRDHYDNVEDFEWYLSVLVDLSYVARVPIGEEIRDQFLDVVTRVRSVRPFAVRLMAKFLQDGVPDADNEGCVEVYWAAAWTCGEYCSNLLDPLETAFKLLEKGPIHLPPTVLAVYMSSAMKIIGYWASDLTVKWDEMHIADVQQKVNKVILQVSGFVDSPHLEVQERTATFGQLLQFMKADLAAYGEALAATADPEGPNFPKSLQLIHPLSSTFELNAVAPEAQDKVRFPEGLDLDTDIVPVAVRAPPELTGKAPTKVKRRKKKDLLDRVVEIGEQHSESSPMSQRDAQTTGVRAPDDLDSIPIVALDGLLLGPMEPQPSSRAARPTVITQGEMPDEPAAQSQSTQPPISLSSEPVQSPGPIPVVRSKKNAKGKHRKTAGQATG
ncbi:AP-3 complex subunit delta [Tulasnella sp. UAMH 9824]|nr:AP-3 complex subunit delta [Tulasnella sp. UAMH 9824]